MFTSHTTIIHLHQTDLMTVCGEDTAAACMVLGIPGGWSVQRSWGFSYTTASL